MIGRREVSLTPGVKGVPDCSICSLVIGACGIGSSRSSAPWRLQGRGGRPGRWRGGSAAKQRSRCSLRHWGVERERRGPEMGPCESPWE